VPRQGLNLQLPLKTNRNPNNHTHIQLKEINLENKQFTNVLDWTLT